MRRSRCLMVCSPDFASSPSARRYRRRRREFSAQPVSRRLLIASFFQPMVAPVCRLARLCRQAGHFQPFAVIPQASAHAAAFPFIAPPAARFQITVFRVFFQQAEMIFEGRATSLPAEISPVFSRFQQYGRLAVAARAHCVDAFKHENGFR